MKKLFAATVVVAALGMSGVAQADPLAVVPDPTPNAAFTGTYTCYSEDEQGNQVEETCTQTGYVAVYDDGAEACNGNENVTRPDDGSALQGYVWVGPNHAASNVTGATPGNYAGAGTNAEDAETGEPTGDSPCNENPSAE